MKFRSCQLSCLCSQRFQWWGISEKKSHPWMRVKRNISYQSVLKIKKFLFDVFLEDDKSIYVQLELWPVSSAIIPQQNAEFYKCTFRISDENIKMMHTELDTMLELFKQQRHQLQVKGEDCPVHSSAGADWLDPRNMMPPANPLPAPNQPYPLPTERQKSSIPR